ncbi:MAG: metallophosphoesterase family protein [Myxococcales bacterium]|nr:serine/threonine protein phosphatase [Polyangiaceae bacterium]MDW8250012.1 metallophosphoesterase family protein [Myxococcales bacterium]
MGRTILIGDVHGCLEELQKLLDKVRYDSDDRLILVGDLVARGPNSAGVVALCRSLGATVIRGNHEEKLLQWRQGKNLCEDSCGFLGPMHLQVAQELTEEDWSFLQATQLFCDLPEHGLWVVHAGVLPGVPLAQQPPHVLLTMRSLGELGEPLVKAGSVPWGCRYFGPAHVIFGHHAQPRPQLHPFATGIDTGCVYGGSLTAMVLDPGQPVPPISKRDSVLYSVDALRRWFGGR